VEDLLEKRNPVKKAARAEKRQAFRAEGKAPGHSRPHQARADKTR